MCLSLIGLSQLSKDFSVWDLSDFRFLPEEEDTFALVQVLSDFALVICDLGRNQEEQLFSKSTPDCSFDDRFRPPPKKLTPKVSLFFKLSHSVGILVSAGRVVK